MTTDLTQFGGIKLVQAAPDGGDSWDFGYISFNAVANGVTPVEQLAPQLTGKWDGKTNISHWDATKLVRSYWNFGDYLPAQRQPRGTCFPAGTLVLMADGTEKAIEEVQYGDMVVTHLNRAMRVLHVGNRCYTGLLYSITVQGNQFTVEMTEEHPVAVFPNIKRKWRRGFTPGNMQWIEAGCLNIKDRVLLPFGCSDGINQTLDMSDYLPTKIKKRPKVGEPLVTNTHVRMKEGRVWYRRYIPIDYAFCRLLGFYLSEGSVRFRIDGKPSGIELTFGSDEIMLAKESVELFSSIFGARARIARDENCDTVIRIRCDSALIGRLFYALCDTGALVKRVPDIIFRATKICRMSVLRGWLDGDGHVRCNKNLGVLAEQTSFVVHGVTSSRVLNRQLLRLAISCGLKPGSYLRKKEKQQRVASTSLVFYGGDGITLYPEWSEKAKRHSKSRAGVQYTRTENGFLCKIKKINKIPVDNLKVYNLEVEEDHSYVAGGIAVHNCVSRGAAGALNVLQAIQMALNGQVDGFKTVSHSAIYGEVRELGGMRGYSDGAVGADAAKALHKWGAVTQEEAGDEVGRAGYYSDDKAVEWGAGRGGTWTPDNVKAFGKDNIVKEIAPVTSSQTLADGLAAGCVCTIASNQGFTMSRDSDGCCRASGSWAHQMMIAAIVVLPSGKRVFGIGQSWGDNTPSGPTLWHSPDYVFGADWDTVERMLRQGDSMLMSAFDAWVAPIPVIPWAERII